MLNDAFLYRFTGLSGVVMILICLASVFACLKCQADANLFYFSPSNLYFRILYEYCWVLCYPISDFCLRMDTFKILPIQIRALFFSCYICLQI